jgi:iron complex transport system ATP-binding protein
VEAPLLLADEPIAALDPYHQLHVMEILRGLADAGTGVLAVVHDLAIAARFMDRLILMDRGAVARDGAPADILTPELIAAVYGVDILSGERDGAGWVLPWTRVAAPAASR